MAHKAKIVMAVAVFASCGKCGEDLTASDGSFQLDIRTSGPIYVCAACGAENRLPKTARVA